MAKKKGPELTDTSRCCLYSPDAPKGQIFVGAEAIEAAQKDGWVDAPDKVKEKAAGGAKGGSGAGK